MTFPRGQLAGDVRSRTRVGALGVPVNSNYLNKAVPYINESPAATQVATVTVDTGTASTLFTVTIEGSVSSYTSLASGDTTSTIATALGLAIEANPAASAYVSLEVATNVITITARTSGETVTITASALSTAAVTTAAVVSEAVAFGVGVLVDGYISDEGDKQAFNAKATLLTPQVVTLDYTYGAGDILDIIVVDKHSGAPIATFSYVLATDKGTSSAAIVVALNALMPASSVIASGTSTIILTAEVAGFEFDASIGGDDATLAGSVTYTTGPTVATSVLRAFAGVTLFNSAIEAATITATTASYPGGGVMAVLGEGAIWVANAETIVQGGKVYIDVGSTNFGKFYTADSAATRLELPNAMARWERSTHSDSGSYAALFINANR